MAVLQFSTPVRNAMLDIIETTIGVGGILRIRSGAAPATPATADSGTVLATITLPSDWMAAAAAGSKAKLGTWEDTVADATGTAAHFRIYDTAGTTVGIQGDVTLTGGGGAMVVDSVSFTAGQDFIVTGFTLNAPNA